MKALNVLLVVILTFTISSCNKELKIEKGDYLIFGHFYGECMVETCIETYKLTTNNLYEDLSDNYFASTYSFTQLSLAQFNDVKNLIDFFPAELLNETETTFGCPDCVDQGGLYIEYETNGNVYSWRIDQLKF